MASLAVFGGSGFAGGHIVEAAVVRGLDVQSVSRSESAMQVAGASYVTGSILDSADRARALLGADTAIVAIPPRGNMVGKVRSAVALIAKEAESSGVRLGVIGGAGSLLVSEGGQKLFESKGFPSEILAESIEMGEVLDDLRAWEGPLDWFYVSPAAEFGAHAAGEYRGEYRLGGDVLLSDDSGRSAISGADFGVAIIDEVEEASHHRTRFTVAY
ncbi:MAG: NAD(P)-dependent oxidoreductase [Leucobacter sp.]